VQINHHHQIEPAFSCPDISDVTYLFLVRSISVEVPFQPIGRNIEAMIAVGFGFVFASSDNTKAIATHQATHTAMSNAQADLLQLLRHTLATLGAALVVFVNVIAVGRDIGWTEAICGRTDLMPERIQQVRTTSLLKCRDFVQAKRKCSCFQVVSELAFGSRTDYDGANGRSRQQPRQCNLRR
jgi:hypothetical protein